jgi:hypothetical protein
LLKISILSVKLHLLEMYRQRCNTLTFYKIFAILTIINIQEKGNAG